MKGSPLRVRDQEALALRLVVGRVALLGLEPRIDDGHDPEALCVQVGEELVGDRGSAPDPR